MDLKKSVNIRLWQTTSVRCEKLLSMKIKKNN